MLTTLPKDSDVRALLTAAGRGPFGERDTAVLLVLLDSGMRLSELTGLNVVEVTIKVTDLVTSLPTPPRVL